VLLLHKGKATEFKSVAEGVKEYSKLFTGKQDLAIEKICSGNETIKFINAKIPHVSFSPGETFSIALEYESDIEYHDAEVDTAIFASNEPALYFQATNRAYHQQICLPKGRHELAVAIQNIPIQGAIAKIAIAVWAHKRTKLLFWWRIPVEFTSIAYSTGKNYLPVIFMVE